MMCRWPPRRWHTGSTRQATRQPESAQVHGPHGESGHPPAAAFPHLQPFDIKPAHAMGGGSAATRGHRTPEPANTDLRAQVVTAADAG